MVMRSGVCVMVLLLALLGPVPSFAEVKMLVTPNGDGSFFLVGDNVIGVTAIDITIGYDSILLENPRVEANGATLTDVYAGTPGKLLVKVSREDPDAAFFLTLYFEKKGDAPGAIHYVTATIRDTEGKSSPVPADIIPPSPPPASPATEPGRSDGTPDVDATAAASSARGVTKPEQSTAAEETIHSDDRTISPLKREKSVLQRFREFKGEKGLKAFASLFKRSDREKIVQEPAIALSDGKTPVVLKLEQQTEGNHSPDIALSNAKLVSVRKESEKSWIITAVPSEGAWEARLVLGTGMEMIDFPLVVAPLIKIANGINEKDFLVALNNYLSDQAAMHQGTSEPYRDEYIFTANYLATLAGTSPKKASR